MIIGRGLHPRQVHHSKYPRRQSQILICMKFKFNYFLFTMFMQENPNTAVALLYLDLLSIIRGLFEAEHSTSGRPTHGLEHDDARRAPQAPELRPFQIPDREGAELVGFEDFLLVGLDVDAAHADGVLFADPHADRGSSLDPDDPIRSQKHFGGCEQAVEMTSRPRFEVPPTTQIFAIVHFPRPPEIRNGFHRATSGH